MSLNDDLASFRDLAGELGTPRHLAVKLRGIADRMEAEIARLERENEHLHLRIQRKNEQMNAAEAEAARLQKGIGSILTVIEDANQPYERLAIGALARALLAEDGAA